VRTIRAVRVVTRDTDGRRPRGSGAALSRWMAGLGGGAALRCSAPGMLHGPRPPSRVSFFFYFHKGLELRPRLVPKIFQDSPSHRILRHIHKTLNIDENKN